MEDYSKVISEKSEVLHVAKALEEMIEKEEGRVIIKAYTYYTYKQQMF